MILFRTKGKGPLSHTAFGSSEFKTSKEKESV